MKTSHLMKQVLFGAVLLSSVLLAVACAQDLEEIDRTQANVTDKRDLEGEWYFRQTVVDTPFASFWTFLGDQSPLERGVFEIQQDTVYFYRTYEFSLHSQTVGLKSDVDTPYLAWLEGDEAAWTPDPYQSRDLKYAEGVALQDAAHAEVPCAGEQGEGGGMHEFCKETVGNELAMCGHVAGTASAARSAETAVCVRPTKYVFRGAPLAAWPISDHFDITYSYNPSTGEKTNVKEENSSDRWWYEQQYMRVDWADNQMKNYQFTLNGMLQAFLDEYEINSDIEVALYSGDAAAVDEEGMRIFRAGTEEGAVPQYMDYLSRYVVKAPSFYFDAYGQDFPACIFYPWFTGGVLECQTEVIATRTAFMKVDGNDTYVPEEYDDHLMDKFGFFRRERQEFDPMYEQTYEGVLRVIERHPIFETYVKKADGTLDYEAMTPKPIVYYLSKGFPREMVPMANELARQWAAPFNETIAALKRKEAVPASGMFVLCENNHAEAQAALAAGGAIAATDETLCRDMDFVKENGDIRYSFLFAVNEPIEAGLLGYGPSSADPLTGKVLSATAYVYMAPLHQYANHAADMIEHMVGFKDYITTTEGLDITFDYFPQQLSVNHNPPPGSVQEAQARAGSLVRGDVRQMLGAVGVDKTDVDFTAMRMGLVKKDAETERSMILPDFRLLFRDISVAEDLPLSDKDAERMALRNWANYKGFQKRRSDEMYYASHRMDRTGFADPAVVAQAQEWTAKYNQEICAAVADLMAKKPEEGGQALAFDLSDFNVVKDACTKEQEGTQRKRNEAPKLFLWKEYNPKDPDAGDTCQYVDQGDVKGYYWVNTCTVAKLGAQISHKLEWSESGDQLEHWKQSPWYTPTQDPQIAATQDVVRGLGEALREEMVKEIEQKLFLSIAIHECGHTLGLRHNFEASTDAMNYPKKYWEMKVAKSADGKTWLPVDLFSPETGVQQAGAMREYQYSSIMDYGAKFNDLLHGLGLYDHAAIKFGYGGIVEVFKNPPDLTAYAGYLADPQVEMAPGESPPVKADADQLERLFKLVHYTQIPNVFGTVDAVYERQDVRFADLVGKECATDADCGQAGGCPGCTECRAQLGGYYCSPPDKVEVPYRFCGDEYATMTPTCDVWDQGADPYEVVRNTIDDYWWYWMWWGRWRGNILYSTDGYAGRVQWAFERMKRQFQWWAVSYFRYNQGDWWQKRFGKRYEEDLNGGLSGANAAYESFMTLTHAFAIPSGAYLGTRVFGLSKKTGRYETLTSYNYNDLADMFVLEEDYGKFAARPMYAAWTIKADEGFQVSGGALYDRLYAFTALADPTTDFLNIDEYPDARKYLISYFTFFPERLIHLLGGLTTRRVEAYAPCVVIGTDKKAQYVKLRKPEELDDPDFCSNGRFLDPEEVDYDFPTTWYRIPMLAAYYGMSLMINNYDRRFMDTTRIFLKGHEDAIDIPVETPKVEFTDPMTGKVYVAYKMGDDNTFDTAWYLVNTAKTLFEEFGTLEEIQEEYSHGGSNELQRMVGLLELIRGLHKLYDYTDLGVQPFDTHED